MACCGAGRGGGGLFGFRCGAGRASKGAVRNSSRCWPRGLFSARCGADNPFRGVQRHGRVSRSAVLMSGGGVRVDVGDRRSAACGRLGQLRQPPAAGYYVGPGRGRAAFGRGWVVGARRGQLCECLRRDRDQSGSFGNSAMSVLRCSYSANALCGVTSCGVEYDEHAGRRSSVAMRWGGVRKGAVGPVRWRFARSFWAGAVDRASGSGSGRSCPLLRGRGFLRGTAPVVRR